MQIAVVFTPTGGDRYRRAIRYFDAVGVEGDRPSGRDVAGAGDSRGEDCRLIDLSGTGLLGKSDGAGGLVHLNGIGATGVLREVGRLHPARRWL